MSNRVSARHATMPPDNATGTFVKAGHGLRVRIIWDDGQDLAQLRVGFLAAVKVCLQR